MRLKSGFVWILMGKEGKGYLLAKDKGLIGMSKQDMRVGEDVKLEDLTVEFVNGYRVSHLQHSFSDHCPVMVDTEGDRRSRVGEQQWQFRFNVDWILQSGFKERLRSEWSSNQQDFLVKLKEVGMRLSAWAAKEKKGRERRTTELNAKLMKLNAGEISDDALEEITAIKLDLNLEANKEEIFWEQRARVNWLQIGDRITSFFHRSASNRKKRNVIKGLVLQGLGASVLPCNEETDWKMWLAIEFNNLNIEACRIRAIAYWAIWYNRNKIYHEGIREQAHEVVGFVKAYCTEINTLGVVLRQVQEVPHAVEGLVDEKMRGCGECEEVES
ncbi:hypothetical protein GOBAR_AA25097 [Gossypium barbadense]|uniref:Reverse transcriptase n=1 Tax=Gossypium barbadense TaxID=3634 RepID=A0A2P5WWX1_GOSBA|nr:hypothetical protein GOBAR_AA25097 [Gossypium barbadense]